MGKTLEREGNPFRGGSLPSPTPTHPSGTFLSRGFCRLRCNLSRATGYEGCSHVLWEKPRLRKVFGWIGRVGI